MYLSEREVITKVFYVGGIREILDHGCYLLCIEEQEEIIHDCDELHVFYNYYMFDVNYGTKMFMYGTKDKCMPKDENMILDYFNTYYKTYINA